MATVQSLEDFGAIALASMILALLPGSAVAQTSGIGALVHPAAVSESATPPVWTAMASFPATVSSWGGPMTISFAIGTNGYIALPCGGPGTCPPQGEPLWKYSPQSDSWTQLRNQPNLLLESPSFIIGENAYVVSGTQVWQYAPASDQWTRKNDIPSSDNRGAFGFSVNGLGYIGGGYYDGCALWEYNPATDSWMAENNIPVLQYGLNDPSACAILGIAFTIGSTAYVTGTNSYFWAYSPDTDTWATKAYVDATYGQAFAIGSSGYVFNTFGALYQYDPIGDQWTSVGGVFPGTTMCYPAGFSVRSSLYVGVGGLFAGNTCELNVINQWWRFGPVSSPAVELTPSYIVFPASGTILPLTVTNSGTAPLSITLPQAFSGFDSFDFSVVTGTTCTNGTTVAPGSSCVINIAFNPLTTSAESATLSLFDNANNNPQIVPLSGGAALASVMPNPVSGSKAAQTVTLTGTGFSAGAVLNWQNLTKGTSGTITPLSVTSSEIKASNSFTNATAAWQLQVANPSGAPSNWFSFEILGSQYGYVRDDYPFQNAAIDLADPYGFALRECTSFVAWRMNRDAGTTNPSYPYFLNKMAGGKWGNATNWNTNATSLGYTVDHIAQTGAIAQWVNGCRGHCATGHVAYVEQVNQDGSIVVSEYNFPETTTINHEFNVRTIAATSQVFPQNFIHVIPLKLASNLLNFGDQPLGSPTQLGATITNPTSVAIPVTAITITGTDKGDFTQTNTCGSSVAPGGSCQVLVTFTPMGQGPRSAIIAVHATAVIPIKEVITLTGSGS